MGNKDLGIYLNIGKKIKDIRKQRGFTQKDFAQLLRIPVTTYANYENGNRTPKTDMIEKIASALEIDVTELLQPIKVTETDLGDGLKQRKEIHGEPGNKLTPEKEEAINKGLLLDSFDKLNDKGQQKAVAYVELLAGHPDYNKDKNA